MPAVLWWGTSIDVVRYADVVKDLHRANIQEVRPGNTRGEVASLEQHEIDARLFEQKRSSQSAGPTADDDHRHLLADLQIRFAAFPGFAHECPHNRGATGLWTAVCDAELLSIET